MTSFFGNRRASEGCRKETADRGQVASEAPLSVQLSPQRVYASANMNSIARVLAKVVMVSDVSYALLAG
jgi:hypothetical protein